MPRFRLVRLLGIAISLIGGQAAGLQAAPQTLESEYQEPQPRLAFFESDILPILGQACFECHGPETQEADLRIDTLEPNLFSGKDVDWWTEVYAVVAKGEMPPPEASGLSDGDRQAVVDWLSGELHLASIAKRQSEHHSSFRRLTRYEFNYALQDLLGLPWDFARDLQPEARSKDGFQNTGELLNISVTQLDTFHRLARIALQRATVRGPQPEQLTWNIVMSDLARHEWSKQEEQLAKAQAELEGDPVKQKREVEQLEASFHQPHPKTYFRNRRTGRTALAVWEYSGAKYANSPKEPGSLLLDTLEQEAILPAGSWLNIELGNQLPDHGTLRVSVRASRASTASQHAPSMQLAFGWQASNEGRALMRVSQSDLIISAPPDQPEVYQWDIPLGEIYPRNSVRNTSPMGALPSPSEYIRLVNSSMSAEDIQVDYVQVLAPVYDRWPPPSHKRIFFRCDAESVDSSGAQNALERTDYARQIISQFMSRAWRRKVSSAEVDQKLKLLAELEPECEDFEDAVIEVLAAVIASPHFLYVVQESGGHTSSEGSSVEADLPSGRFLTDHELAMRLSLFLWCSIPDDELLEVASSGRLSEPGVLADQVQRLLDDSRSHRFSQHFVHQWLNLELLDFLNLSQHLPHFDPLLKEAMQFEPICFFEEALKGNETVFCLLHSDFAMLNERLARHYGLTEIHGNEFRRVGLPPDFRRGGLLSQAGLLAMNADYPDSHPLKRGKWLLESLLNDPPPPPPPAVPQIDLANPEIAKMSLKERIEDHRNHAACKSCHSKIDPWGIAFENYDALGQWRDEIQGSVIDAKSELASGQPLDGIEGLKRLLLNERQDQFVQALVYKVATYALGRPLEFSDRADLETISATVRRKGDGLRDLITAIATSRLFRSK